MKKSFNLIYTVGLAAIIACGSGDEEDRLPQNGPPDNGAMERCENVVSTLSGNVLPIIASNCAIPGCHISGGQFPDFTDRQNVISHATLIRSQTESGNMPAAESGLTLTAQEKNEIYCWVTGGAPDN